MQGSWLTVKVTCPLGTLQARSGVAVSRLKSGHTPHPGSSLVSAPLPCPGSPKERESARHSASQEDSSSQTQGCTEQGPEVHQADGHHRVEVTCLCPQALSIWSTECHLI